MKKEELVGKRIARKALREMLNSTEHRQDVDAVADRYVKSYSEALYAHKHIRIFCRQLAAALRKMP